MRQLPRLVLLSGLALASCAMTPPLREVPVYDVRDEGPGQAPYVPAATAELVPYPDLEVSLVVADAHEIYHCRGLFFCVEDGRWFYAHGLTGTWSFIETKYVPPDLFRARGHFPPGVDAAALVRARTAPGERTRPVAVRN